MSSDLQSATAAAYRAAISELRSATKRLTKFADGLILANDRLADECCALWSTLRLKQIAVRRLHPAAPEVWFVRTPRTIATHERAGDGMRTSTPAYDAAPFDAAVDALAIELDRIDAGIAPAPAAAVATAKRPRKRRRGAPRVHDANADAKLYEQWQVFRSTHGLAARKEDFAREIGRELVDVKAALHRERKRRTNSA